MNPEQAEPTVSVVIPAYNAEKTLRRMLDSVLGQTWQKMQVILVDDGSSDGTVALAREAAKKDPRLTVIAGESLGVSATRNRALELCSGKYTTTSISARSGVSTTWQGGTTPFPATG